MKTIDFYSCKGLPNQRNYCLERCKSSVQGGKRASRSLWVFSNHANRDKKSIKLTPIATASMFGKFCSEEKTLFEAFDGDPQCDFQNVLAKTSPTEILSAISKIFLIIKSSLVCRTSERFENPKKVFEGSQGGFPEWPNLAKVGGKLFLLLLVTRVRWLYQTKLNLAVRCHWEDQGEHF